MTVLTACILCFGWFIFGLFVGMTAGRVDRVEWKTGDLSKSVSVRGIGNLEKRLKAAIEASDSCDFAEPDWGETAGREDE